MKVQEKMYVHWDGLREKFCLFPFVMSAYPMVKEVLIEYEAPDDFNPVAAEIASLQAEERAVREQFDKRVHEIHERISKLQCLEMMV